MSYHARIMNIPANGKEMDSTAYRMGHRDARHAAAEIASEAEARVAELTEALRRSETLANGIIERNQGGYVGDWNDTKEILATVRAALAAEKGGEA